MVLAIWIQKIGCIRALTNCIFVLWIYYKGVALTAYTDSVLILILLHICLIKYWYNKFILITLFTFISKPDNKVIPIINHTFTVILVLL